VRAVLNRIIVLMTIPLIQGTLRYAYKMGAFGPAGDGTNLVTSNDFLKQAAEGSIFAFAVLPQIAACNASDAAFIHDALQIGGGTFRTTAVHMEVKARMEKNYPCLGVTCADIGALNVAGGLGSATDPFGVVCTDYVAPPATVTVTETVNQTVTVTTETTVETMSGGAIAGIIVAAVFAVLFCLFIAFIISKEKAGQPIFTPIDASKAAA
jgi:hypothetical protein